ncbi:c-type cytochrome biogenesis protein CcsB [Amycolatopsis vastitatis]|uniref:C-type cytochrome biogenesis protein CcsB n=1 Tax=Amycolatopsis vastitatis TaxID=1905142 RepID=A0A229TEF9_9PSEU|nr:c-type cytochrome biogenesis protein CcsB [Amycolatopsis vastitatis]OXM69548.1 c-type cytochrome biogenesis protein CcsB [Amycolatopsis vastitatis]
MPLEPGLAMLSDWLFISAYGIYMLAALLAAAEYAVGRYPVGRREAAMSGTGAPPPPGYGPVPSTRRSFPERCGRTAVALTVLGAVLHAGSVLLRGLATSRVPWGNMYEYMSMVGLVAVVGWLSVLRKHPVRTAAVFVLLPISLLLFLAGNVLYTEAAPVQPSLRSYWVLIHVAAAIMASGVFLISGITSALHLVSTRHAAEPGREPRVPRLPSPEFLDKLAYRTGVFGFATMTFAIITGAVWAESAWGRYWAWDPKETAAFVSWVCYAAYLHARSTPSWRKRRAAWVNLVGLVAVLFNLFFVNLAVSGLHSYAGVG